VTKGKPTAIIAKTFKGKNFPNIEDLENWHGKPLGDKADSTIKHLTGLLKNAGPLQLHPQKPLVEDAPAVNVQNVKLSSPPNYKLGQTVATRESYGVALAKLAEGNKHVIALDGDTKNSTFSDKIKKVFKLKADNKS
jgi:transketolase